jgi:hypothetical protein
MHNCIDAAPSAPRGQAALVVMGRGERLRRVGVLMKIAAGDPNAQENVSTFVRASTQQMRDLPLIGPHADRLRGHRAISCLTYRDANRLVGVVIMATSSLPRVRMNIAMRSVAVGARFAEGTTQCPAEGWCRRRKSDVCFPAPRPQNCYVGSRKYREITFRNNCRLNRPDIDAPHSPGLPIGVLYAWSGYGPARSVLQVRSVARLDQGQEP